MALSAVLSRLKVQQLEIQNIKDKVSAAETPTRALPQEIIRAIWDRAAAYVTPTARQMMLANLKASGIKSHTGDLEGAVSTSSVRIKWVGNSPKMRIAFRGGLDKRLYVYGNALNSGAVRGPKGMSDRGCKKVRKAVLAIAQSGASKWVYGRGKTSSTAGFSVTKPRNYYQLSGGQVSRLQAMIKEFVQTETAKL